MLSPQGPSSLPAVCSSRCHLHDPALLPNAWLRTVLEDVTDVSRIPVGAPPATMRLSAVPAWQSVSMSTPEGSDQQGFRNCAPADTRTRLQILGVDN